MGKGKTSMADFGNDAESGPGITYGRSFQTLTCKWTAYSQQMFIGQQWNKKNKVNGISFIKLILYSIYMLLLDSKILFSIIFSFFNEMMAILLDGEKTILLLDGFGLFPLVLWSSVANTARFSPKSISSFSWAPS